MGKSETIEKSSNYDKIKSKLTVVCKTEKQIRNSYQKVQMNRKLHFMEENLEEEKK